MPDLEDAAISPNGKRNAVLFTANGLRALRILEGQKVIKTVPVGEEKIRSVSWATDDLVMVNVSRTEKLSMEFAASKAEFWRTLFIDLNGSPTRILFQNQKKIAAATFGNYGIRQVGEKRYGYFGGVALRRDENDTNIESYVFEGGAPGLYQVDFTNFSIQLVAPPAAESERRDWILDVNGKLAASLILKDNGDWRLVNGQSKLVASGKQKYGDVQLIGLGQGSQSVVLGEASPETGDMAYSEIALVEGARSPFGNGKKIDRFYNNHMTGEVLGYKTLDGGNVFFDLEVGKKRAKIAKAFPNYDSKIIDHNDKFTRAIIKTSGTKDSGTYWKVDLDAKSASPLGYEYANIMPDDVGPISTVDYVAGDGMTMSGILTLPPKSTGKNLPAIMLPHGGPNAHDEAVFDWWAQAFAARGYAVFQPNFRGSTNRDDAFARAGNGEWGKKMQSDISDGLTHLVKSGIVDPKRTCIVGASYGGYAALAGVTLQTGLYRCAVSVAGVSDLPMMIETDKRESGYDNMLARNLKVMIGAGRDLKEVSPRRFAGKTDAPVLLIHGKDDTVVPIKQSQVMADALKDAKKPFEFVILPGEDHWLSKGETRLKMLTSAIAFVEKHNPAK